MAGLIPQSFIDDLLDRVDIVEVIDRRVRLRKLGANYSALCPFHEEKTPSFNVNPQKQFYYCFGCGAGGNALSFLIDYENLEFPQAVEQLAGSVGMRVPREEGDSPARRGQRELYPLLERAADFYRRQLREHPDRAEAANYLRGRGLSEEVAKLYQLGYAPDGWDSLLSALGGDEERQRRLIKAGLVVENEQGRRYDRFRRRIIFPIHDRRGRAIAFGGRVLGDEQPKYLNSPETPVFHKGRELYGLYQARKANRELRRLLVVEGYMDVIALAQHGIRYAAATLGTATSTSHLEQVYRLCPEVVFCFDGDEAGRKAASRALESTLPALQDGRQARFLFLPEGEDPDSLVRKRDARQFLRRVEAATPLEQYLFENLSEGLNLSVDADRATLSKRAAPLLARIPIGVFKQLLYQRLAELTGIDPATLQGIVDERQPAAPPAAARPRPRQRPPKTGAARGIPNLAQRAIAIVSREPGLAATTPAYELLRESPESDTQFLVEILDLLRKREDWTTPMIIGRFYGEQKGGLLVELASRELLPEHKTQAYDLENELQGAIQRLNQRQREAALAAQFDKFKGRNYAEISQSERLEARHALDELRRLDEERRGQAAPASRPKEECGGEAGSG